MSRKLTVESRKLTVEVADGIPLTEFAGYWSGVMLLMFGSDQLEHEGWVAPDNGPSSMGADREMWDVLVSPMSRAVTDLMDNHFWEDEQAAVNTIGEKDEEE